MSLTSRCMWRAWETCAAWRPLICWCVSAPPRPLALACMLASCQLCQPHACGHAAPTRRRMATPSMGHPPPWVDLCARPLAPARWAQRGKVGPQGDQGTRALPALMQPCSCSRAAMQGKVEKSLLTFVATYPTWEPGLAGAPASHAGHMTAARHLPCRNSSSMSTDAAHGSLSTGLQARPCWPLWPLAPPPPRAWPPRRRATHTSRSVLHLPPCCHAAAAAGVGG